MRKIEIVDVMERAEDKKKINIKYPLYKQDYVEAIKIFMQNSKKYEECRYGQKGYKRELEDYLSNMNNVITVVGKRGSGKTTVMKELLSVFKTFNDYKYEWFKEVGEPYASDLKAQLEDEYIFWAMDTIDASVLEDKDDLIEIILWYMCDKIKDKVEEDKYRGICNYEIQKFMKILEEVYRMHQSVKNQIKEEISGESVVTLLEKMPNSIRTCRAMEELLEKFFFLLCPEKEKNAYLIIAIDDLDLNISKGYPMLEEIRRYLLNWRIIVLLAVESEQMGKVCESHLRKEFGRTGGAMNRELDDHIADLSNSYMTKVLPIFNRIYLSESRLKTSIIKEEIGQKVIEVKIKNFILSTIAKKMHIYYDALGLKTHFCEANTVRELVSYIHFLDSLNTITWEIEENIEDREGYFNRQLRYYNQNHERFNQDIEMRMAFEKLDSLKRKLFFELLSRDLERRVGYVLICYKNTMAKKNSMEVMSENEHYRFGDFLECIYKWGRDNYEYKPFIHCLLASFTSEMTREYFNYRYNIDNPKSAERSKRRLEGYMGEGIISKWLSDSFGAYKDDVSIYNLTQDEERELYTLDFMLHTEEAFHKKSAMEKFKCILQCYEERDFLPILECIFLCMSNYVNTRDGSKCKPQIRVKESKVDGGNLIRVEIENAKYADWDILGFVKYSLDYSTWQETVGNPLEKQLIECARAIAGYEGKLDGKGVKVRYEQFLRTSVFFDWIENHEMALPLYNLDLSYNIFKRVRRKCEKDSSSVSEHNIVEKIQTIYQYIEDELAHEEEAYNSLERAEKMFKYKDIFVKDPYVKKFRELAMDMNNCKLLASQIRKLSKGAGKAGIKVLAKSEDAE